MCRVCAKIEICIHTFVPGVQKSVLEVVLNRLAVLETQQKVHFALLNEILNTIKRSAVVDSSTEPPEELSLPVDSVDDLIELEAKIQSREIRKELVRHEINCSG